MKSVVVTFVPHPKGILSDINEKYLIFPFEDKNKFLEELNVDYLVELKFNRDFSTLSPKEFLEKHFIVSPFVKLIHLGHDFCFGAKKSGDYQFFKRYLKEHPEYQLELSQEKSFKKSNEIVSSSLIRKYILDGEVEISNELLGKNFFVRGMVMKGDGRGREIGFPTANLSIDEKIIYPGNGVYITRVKWKDMKYYAVTNVGTRPTFKDERSPIVETHIFDFNRDIYGEELKIDFFSKIRDEKKFKTANDLIHQIQQDINYAQSMINHLNDSN